jgi:hypothetical protein
MAKKKSLEQVLGIKKALIKQALIDLKEYCPEIESLSDEEKARKLLEWLAPEKSLPTDPEELDEWARTGKWILPKHVKGFVDSPFVSDLLGTGWGNCAAFSCLYAILARHLGLENCVPAATPMHMVNFLKLGKKWIYIDATAGMWSEDWEGRKKLEAIPLTDNELVEYAIIREYAKPQRIVEYSKKLLKKDFSEIEKALILSICAIAYKRLGQQNKAMVDAEKAYEIFKRTGHKWYWEATEFTLTTGYHNLGKEYFEEGQYAKAAEAYEKLLQFDESYFYLEKLAKAYRELSQLKKALKSYTRAIKIGEKESKILHEAYKERGLIYLEQLKIAKAVADLKKARKLYKKKGLFTKAEEIDKILKKELGKA